MHVKHQITLQSSCGETVVLRSGTVLVFIDETGEEQFNDKNYPIFGLGGCAVQVQNYEKLVNVPWLRMKNNYFDGADKPLHANELRNPSKDQLEALNHFFTKFHFCRIAAIVSDKTVFEATIDPYEITAGALKNRILDVAKWQQPFKSMALIFEDSQRGNKLAVRNFSNFNELLVDQKTKIPVGKFFMPKALNFPGLEVADFIMHAAGGQTRTRLKHGVKKSNNRDFKAVFRSMSSKRTSFIEINKVEVTSSIKRTILQG